jgi:glycosyltransferase involved in cell wall biosynthesis
MVQYHNMQEIKQETMVTPVKSAKLRLACVGTFPPRRCGIGTFTYDLCDAISTELSSLESCQVVALNDIPEGYGYDSRVCFDILDEDISEYTRAADFLNIRGVSAILLQHEFGIYGGADGSHVLTMMRDSRMPILTTLHTVLSEPSPSQREVFDEVARLSDRLVVMSQRSVDVLLHTYGIPQFKIAMIPHGIPDLPFVDPSFYKEQFGVEGRKVMLTFGLLSPAKGIEHAIEALPEIVKQHPELVYIVLGATHPNVRKENGEEYRNRLHQKAEDLGVLEHVIFVNRYVKLEELCEFLCAADIYVTPYLGKQQVVSGTLAYALGAGNAVISTPYSYAEEMLADGRGRMVPFGDSAAIAREACWLLNHETETQAIRKQAYLFTRDMIWRSVARQYLQLCTEVLSERSQHPKPLPKRSAARSAQRHAMPELKLDYLIAMTDDTGILQHARYTIPDRSHGYCTDDNARALIVALQAYQLKKDPEFLRLIHTYLSFLDHAYNRETRRFRNFMSYDRRWLEDIGSEDSHARALWGLGYAAELGLTTSVRAAAVNLYEMALKETVEFNYPRSWAFTLVGVHAYLRRFSGDSEARRIRETLAMKLFDKFEEHSDDDWPWPEDCLSYANGKLPHALLLGGQMMQREDLIKMGLRSLDWLLQLQTGREGVFSPIGNDGWFKRGGCKAAFDQQPIEAHAMLDACLEAHNVTGDDKWVSEARRCFNWFLGKNDLGEPLYDYQTGGCRDGLSPKGVNQNEGAESTLVWLLSLLALKSVQSAPEDAQISEAVSPPA